ncbi:MAG: helix-turn-helix domain-containing protein [Thomasclavelia sp.]|uniref:helix-turn-helix domain-containing protein n=1 Tax=Thomasclavelia sp. TaxID=3025757 RepID=UPI0039A26B46
MPKKITLKAARVNAGLTIKEASKLLGVCEATLIKWEKDPSIIQNKYRDIISEVYDFPSDFIIFRKNSKV